MYQSSFQVPGTEVLTVLTLLYVVITVLVFLIGFEAGRLTAAAVNVADDDAGDGE